MRTPIEFQLDANRLLGNELIVTVYVKLPTRISSSQLYIHEDCKKKEFRAIMARFIKTLQHHYKNHSVQMGLDLATVPEFIELANDPVKAAKVVHTLRDGFIEDYMNDKKGLKIIDGKSI